MNANSHLKIYASIRQEAFTNYRSDIKANLFAATTSLNYSDEDLHGLLDQLARCYEGCSSFADFLGLNVIRHGRRPAPEDSFRYVRRHTCGRPRDLVAIASPRNEENVRQEARALLEARRVSEGRRTTNLCMQVAMPWHSRRRSPSLTRRAMSSLPATRGCRVSARRGL